MVKSRSLAGRARGGRIPQFAALISKVERWSGRAVPDSVGYRLVRTFRTELIMAVYDVYGCFESTKNKRQPRRALTNQADEPVWRLLSERPGHWYRLVIGTGKR